MKDEQEVKKFIEESINILASDIEDATLINDQEHVIWLKGRRSALERFLEWYNS